MASSVEVLIDSRLLLRCRLQDHAILIEQLDVLRAVARAQVVNETVRLGFDREPGHAFPPVVGPEDQHGADCTLVRLH
jgi:hypothetical protein